MAAIIEKESTAYHEAGHAVAYILTDRKFKYATIKPNDKEGSLGHVMPLSRNNGFDYYYNMSIEKLFGETTRKYAGVLAEAIYTGRKNHIGASTDYKHIADLVLSVFGQDGPTLQLFLKFIRSHTTDMLQANWQYIERIANGLLINEALSYDDILKLRTI